MSKSNIAIDKIDYSNKIRSKVPNELIEEVKIDLYMQLHAALCRSFALVWKKKRDKVKDDIYKKILDDTISKYKLKKQ